MTTKERIRKRKLAEQLAWPLQECISKNYLEPYQVLEVLKGLMDFIHGDAPKYITNAWISAQMRKAGYGGRDEHSTG